MATTYKLVNIAGNDGSTYIDLPISGRLASVTFSLLFIAGAGGVGYCIPEISRVAVNQTSTSNPRGVIAQAVVATTAASTGAKTNVVQYPDEPVKSGERLYLNCANVANAATNYAIVFLTIN